jgi:hypothetical protein
MSNSILLRRPQDSGKKREGKQKEQGEAYSYTQKWLSNSVCIQTTIKGFIPIRCESFKWVTGSIHCNVTVEIQQHIII